MIKLPEDEQYLVIAIEESSVTARGWRHRTTIPSRIFRELKLQDRDKLVWTLTKNGVITITKKDAAVNSR